MDELNIRKDQKLYSTFLTILKEHKKVDESVKLLKTMKKRGVKPNEFHYCTVMIASFMNREIDKGIELFEEFLGTNQPINNVIGSVAMRLYAKKGDVQAVHDMANLLRKAEIE